MLKSITSVTSQSHFSNLLPTVLKYIMRLIVYACQHVEIINKTFLLALVSAIYDLGGYRPAIGSQIIDILL